MHGFSGKGSSCADEVFDFCEKKVLNVDKAHSISVLKAFPPPFTFPPPLSFALPLWLFAGCSPSLNMAVCLSVTSDPLLSAHRHLHWVRLTSDHRAEV